MKQLLARFLSFFPTPLPLGMTAYATWQEDVIALIGPIADADSLKFCVASEVLRVGPAVNSVSKNYFVRRVRAGAAKQIAGAVFTQIKEKQQTLQREAQQAALAAQKAVEVTPAPKAESETPVQQA